MKAANINCRCEAFRPGDRVVWVHADEIQPFHLGVVVALTNPVWCRVRWDGGGRRTTDEYAGNLMYLLEAKK